MLSPTSKGARPARPGAARAPGTRRAALPRRDIRCARRERCGSGPRASARKALGRAAGSRRLRDSAICSGRTLTVDLLAGRDRRRRSARCAPSWRCSRRGRSRPCPSDARRTVPVEEIRLADEIGDVAVGRLVVELARLPICTMRPSRMMQTRSLIDSASSWSCVTRMKVMPSERCRFCSSICISRRSLRSSAASGSSRSSTFGSLISARASATRCCWPPESSQARRLS